MHSSDIKRNKLTNFAPIVSQMSGKCNPNTFYSLCLSKYTGKHILYCCVFTFAQYRNDIIIKFWIFSACQMVVVSLEDLSTLKPCNSVVSEEDFIGLSADYLERLSQQILSVNLVTYTLEKFCNNAIYNATIKRKLHCKYRENRRLAMMCIESNTQSR